MDVLSRHLYATCRQESRLMFPSFLNHLLETQCSKVLKYLIELSR
jgi:hypothetical protein